MAHAASLAPARHVSRVRAAAPARGVRAARARAPRRRPGSPPRASPEEAPSGYAEHAPTIGDVERLMDAAIDSDDFENAAVYRDLLRTMRNSEIANVADANERFYDAFRKGDIHAMRACWGKGDHVQCLHPGAACVGGDEDVARSWEIVFSGVPKGVGLEIQVEQTRVHASGDFGFVTCVEKARSDDGYGVLACTNVFERQKGEWKIVHHHAHGIR
jgi:translation initiation factor 2A